MSATVRSQIVHLVKQAFELAKSVGIPNLLQPGLVKEMIIAEILGHEVIVSKRDADARDPDNPNITYEYLTCKEGGSGQLDRMFKHPPEKREQSLQRITRNSKVYLAIFYADNQIKVRSIYEVEPKVLAQEAIKRLERSTNQISHFGISEAWARRNGTLVFRDNSHSPEK